jgi:hypothetical protein
VYVFAGSASAVAQDTSDASASANRRGVGTGKAFNPDIAVIGDFPGDWRQK